MKFPLALVIGALAPGQATAQQFSIERIIDTSVGPVALPSFVDLDGDGDLDMLRPRAVTGDVLWAENDGSGRMIGSRAIAVGQGDVLGYARVARGADLNVDGLADVVVLHLPANSPAAIRMYRGLGGGEFDAPVTVATGPQLSRNLWVRDLDQDGDTDLILRTSQDEIQWLENMGPDAGGTPTWSSWNALFPSAHSGGPSLVRYIDFDADGRLDLAAIDPTTRDLLLRRGDSNGGFAPQERLPLGGSPRRLIEFMDVDMDGDLDLVADENIGNWLFWYRNDGGAFADPQLIATMGTRPTDFRVVDIDGDGDDDLAVIEQLSRGVQWFERTGAGFTPRGSLIPGSVASREESLGISDLDGDGGIDVWTADDRVLWVAAGTPSGPKGPFALGFSQVEHEHVTSGDMDGDGDADLVMSSRSSVSIAFNLGDGTFDDGQVVSSRGATRGRPIIADLDGDGNDDVALAMGPGGPFGARVVVHHGLGGGALGPARTVRQGVGFQTPQVVAGDVDGDGDTDLFTREREAQGFSAFWLLNDGAGGFIQGPSATFNTGGIQLAVDLDQDGADELIGISHGAGGLCVLRFHASTPQGQIQAPVVLSPLPQGCPTGGRIAPGDLDGDGLVDIVVYDASLGTISVLDGIGGGAFAAMRPLQNAATPGVQLKLGDVDLDGDLDLLAGTASNAYLYVNTGGVLDAGVAIRHGEGGVEPTSLEFVDLDGDLDLDLVKGSTLGPIVQQSESRLGVRVCSASDANSSGRPGTITATGALSVAANDLTLLAADLPANQFGVFLVSDASGTVVNPGGGLGTLCLGGAIGRYSRTPMEVRFTGATGQTDLAIDLFDVPTPNGSEALAPGDTRLFQFWFRDMPQGSNLTGAIAVTFE